MVTDEIEHGVVEIWLSFHGRVAIEAVVGKVD